jgi:hypothetical protein
MGSQTTESTTTRTIPGAHGQELQARDIMMQLARSGMQDLDVSNLAGGRMQVTPEDEQLMRRIMQAASEMRRQEALRDFEGMSGAVESSMLERGIGGSSIEALQTALLGRELQHTLGQGGLQDTALTAQGLQQLPFQRAGVQLSANQLLLQQILSGAGGVAGMGLQERLNQGTETSTSKQPFDWSGAAMTAGKVAAGIAFPPAGAAIAAGELTTAPSYGPQAQPLPDYPR